MQTSAATPQIPMRAGRRQWFGLAVLALPTLLLSIDASVLYLALPHLAGDLQPSGTELLWTIDIYGFMIAGFLITMGRLGDRIGHRKLLMVGAVAFGAASAMAAYSPDPTILILARGLLGVAGATMMPATLALISRMFHDPQQRGVAIGIWAACFSAGIALGPLVGGALLEVFWWGSVFLLAVPVMVVLLIAAPLLLPESSDPDAERLDIVSVALSLGAILPVIYGIKSAAEAGLNAVSVIAVLVGLSIGALFVYRQQRLTSPLLDVSLFRDSSLVGAVLALLLGLAVVGAVYMYGTQFLQSVAGYSPLVAGLWLLPSAVAMILTSVMAPGLARRFSPGPMLAAALMLCAAGYLLLVLAKPGDGGVAIVVTSLVIVYAGIGPMMALGTDLVVGNAPPDRAGSAAALSETSMEFGLALGIAVLGSLGTAVYRSGIEQTMPSAVPDAAATASHESLGSAVAQASQLPADTGAALTEAAKAAFVDGLIAVGAVSAVVTALTAIMVGVLLRNARLGHVSKAGG